MQKTWIFVLPMLVAGLMSVVSDSEVAAQTPQAAPGKGLAAIDRAAKAGKYLFVFFYRQDDQQTRSMGEIFNSATNVVAARADAIAVPIADPSEGGIVGKFGVKEAPMPLVVVLAPNGAVTASFPSNFTKEQLLGGFGTPAMEKLLGTLQQGKLVLLCVQNGGTRGNAEAMNGVRAFKADERYAAATEVLLLDPSLPAERPFLAKLGVNAPVDEALTLFVAPPGSVIGSYKGATEKNELVATLTKAISSCAAGCQPGQCCPPAK